MTNPTILMATWADGLVAMTGDGHTREFANQPDQRARTGRARRSTRHCRPTYAAQTLGGEWRIVATSEFELSCCIAVGDAIYVGTEDAHILRLPQVGLLHPVESFNHVAGRQTWFAGSAIVNGQRLGPPLGIRSVAVNSNGTILFANVHVVGSPRSVDGGRIWQPTIVVAASAIGLCISRNGGATWKIERDGLHAPYCSAVAFSGDDILVSAPTDHFSAQGRIYRRRILPDA